MVAVTKLDRIDIGFSPREVARIEEDAQRAFRQTRLSEREIAAGFMRPGSPAAASYEEIRDHVAFCAIVSRAYQITVDPGASWGESRERIAEIAEAKAARRRRGAGARAVANRYGDEAARRIIGRTVNH